MSMLHMPAIEGGLKAGEALSIAADTSASLGDAAAANGGLANIAIADGAAHHILGCSGVLRIRVQSGGCAGMRYLFSFEEGPTAKDLIAHHPSGARVLVDPLSHIFLEGGTLDYRSELLASSFVFVNPKASNACGCGDSFSIF